MADFGVKKEVVMYSFQPFIGNKSQLDGATVENGKFIVIADRHDGYVAGVGVILGGCLCKKQFLTFFKKHLIFA